MTLFPLARYERSLACWAVAMAIKHHPLSMAKLEISKGSHYSQASTLLKVWMLTTSSIANLEKFQVLSAC